MTEHDSSSEFDGEDDLETFLELALPQLLASLDMDLLIIGRQVTAGPRCRIDLLAIGTDGTICVIELKLESALPDTTAQVLEYLSAIENRGPEDFIRLAVEEHRVDLPNAFERQFGRSLPEGINATQHVIVIAQSFHPRTENNLKYLRRKGYAITAFRYDLSPDGLRLTSACLEDGASEQSSVRAPLRERRWRSRTAAPISEADYSPRIDVQWFWHLFAPLFVADIVVLQSAYAAYQKWMDLQVPEGSDFKSLSVGPFARQLRNLLESSGNWNRVFLLPGTRLDPFQPLTQPPSTRTYITDGHRIVAYQRTLIPIFRA